MREIGRVVITQETKNGPALTCDHCGHGFYRNESARLMSGKDGALTILCEDAKACEENQ